MNRALNYIGQLRLYSIVDLILILLAAKSNATQLAGALFLWLGFIFYLELKHSHKYRESFPRFLWIISFIIGVVLFRRLEAVAFILLSYLYSRKMEKYFGYSSPLFRGLQTFFLVGALTGYAAHLPWIALVLITVRNLLGDFRDVTKDRKDKMKTIPVMSGFKNNLKYAHLVMTLITSYVWWSFSELGVVYLIGALLIEILTYRMTPR